MFSNYKFKINRYPSLPITPKGVMNEIHHHIFYQYITSDDVIVGICGLDDHKGSPLRIKSHQMYFPTIMHYALRITNSECTRTYNPTYLLSLTILQSTMVARRW